MQNKIIAIKTLIKEFSKKRDWPQVAIHYKELITLTQDNTLQIDLANSLRNAGYAKIFERKYEEARNFLKGAALILQQLGKLGNFERIFVNDYEQELLINGTLVKSVATFGLMVNLGICEGNLGNHNGALAIFNALEQDFKDIYPNKNILPKAQNLLGRVYFYTCVSLSKKENKTKALQYCKLARENVNEPLYIFRVMIAEAKILLSIKEPQKAEKLLFQAKEYLKKTHLKVTDFTHVNIDEDIARCKLATGNYLQAKELLLNCQKAYETIDKDREWVWVKLAQVNAKLGLHKEASENYLKAISVIEANRSKMQFEFYRQTYLSDLLKIYTSAILYFTQTGQIETAYNLVRKTKARTFIEKMGLPDNFEPLQKHETFQTLSRKIDRLYANIFVSEDRASASAQLYNAEAKYLELIRNSDKNIQTTNSINNITLETLQNALNTNEILLDYFVTENETLIFALTKDGIAVQKAEITKSDVQKMSATIAQMLLNIESTQSQTEKELLLKGYSWYAKTVYESIIKPVEQHLRNKKRLLLVPHLGLHLIPFCVLEHPLADVKLGTLISIVYLPTAEMLVRQNKEKTPPNNTLIISNPLDDLAHASRESYVISLTAPNAKVVSWKFAEKNYVLAKMSNYGIIHFACHAKFNPKNPLFSYFLLSGPNTRTRITLNDIYSIKINAQLVVLSGCETGVGNTDTADEISCFQRAFLFAGAKAVLVSLWKIDDYSTSVFMDYFYTEVFKNSLPIEEALRKTQSKMRGSFTPYHWAAFQLFVA